MPNLIVAHHGTQEGVPDQFIHTLAIDSILTPQEDAVVGVRDAFADLWVTLSAEFPTAVTYTHVTAAEILNLSTGALSAASRADFTAGMTGTGSPSLPPQVAEVVSLRAGTRPNGTPLRGRFYMPAMVGQNSTSTGTLTASAQGDLLARMTEYLIELRTRNLVPCVWSRTLGVMPNVDEVRVGNFFDTIRSRRNAEPETYLTNPIP